MVNNEGRFRRSEEEIREKKKTRIEKKRKGSWGDDIYKRVSDGAEGGREAPHPPNDPQGEELNLRPK